MKNILLASGLFVLSVINIHAQEKNNFEGVITYAISFDGSGLPPEALAMFKGAETVTFIKGDKRRVDMNMPMQNSTVIMDAKTKTMVNLMEIMGQKYLIRMKEADIKKDQEKNPESTIKYTDETKVIAGYLCKKAEVTVKSKQGKDELVNVFYTDEIPNSDLKIVYKGLKGFPLEYTVTQAGIKMSFTTKSILKENVADSKFEIPKEGYVETTMEGLQKSMEKMGGQ